MPGDDSRGKERSKAFGVIAAARIRPKGLPSAAGPCPVVQLLLVAPTASMFFPAVDPHVTLQGHEITCTSNQMAHADGQY